jgi:hypothetical protein
VRQRCISFVIVLDATAVAPVFEKSYAMFSSILGTWLPFLSIFAATYLTGIRVRGAAGACQRILERRTQASM